ncbi:hypothetical protein MHU86_15174 [Fragilaria crotonensis]|nr:hypothetical protein MHU86_15174 [Fragilaria crotonensis]
MSIGTGPPPPLGSHPNGIDITDPKYAFNTEDWIETPRQFPEAFINGTTMTLRKENDFAYQKVGNPSTWERYITFGYHAYDHCFQFETQWERMKEIEVDALTFIWNVYSYHLNRALDMPEKLERWAIDIARPYLLNNLPSALTPDTTDPRNARLIYEEPDFMDFDASTDGKLPAIEWQVINSIQHGNSPVVTQQTTTEPDNSFVQINDGTIRITVKWKPAKYEELTDDITQWNYEATDLIHYILGTAKDSVIYPWKTESGAAPAIPFIDLTPDNLSDYLGKRTLPIGAARTFVFSFRLCLPTGPSKWLKIRIPNVLDHHHVELSISNASSDSGEITTAGYIFFKHPTFTQRFFYLKELRRKLPPATPFFDIFLFRKTPTGRTVPHLIVKCGENHVGALTEILSTYLNGTETSVFLGRLLISKMSTDEVDAIFQTHSDFVTSLRCLSLSPVVQNIDRVRTEYRTEGNILRTARLWAKTLLDEEGNSLRCDAENGGDNQRAHLLVPVENLNRARQALAIYKESISPFSLRENHFAERIAQAHPAEIYVPTAAANHNLNLIKGLSTTTTWENAPPSIRQPPNNTSPTPTYRPPSMESQTKRYSDTAQREFPDLTPRFQTKKDTQQRLESTTQQSMTDTSTTNSLMTKSLATQQRFHELESVIRQQNIDIRAHQAAFLAVNTRFDDLEERVITTMTFCKDTSQNVLELRKETNENILGMRQEASAQAAEFRQTFAHLTKMMTSLAGSSGSTDADEDDSTASSDQSDNMSVQSLDTTKHGTSPRKQKGKRRRQNRNLDSITKNHNPKPDQDPSAQYKENSTPDEGET